MALPKMGFHKFLLACPNANIQDKACTTRQHIMRHENIVCSISGGADSDCMLRVVWECDDANKVRYFFVDTGLEMQATKDHIEYLKELYGIEIETVKPKVTTAASVLKHGYPFLSKLVSEKIHSLQVNNFEWKDAAYDDIKKKYRCGGALKWWSNCKITKGEHKPLQSEIGAVKFLKEFLIKNPPQIRISDTCCDDCKKNPAHEAQKGADLVITGIRKAEGGQRSLSYKNCFLEARGTRRYDLHMPLFWWTDADKKAFEERFGILHSRAYTEYGFKRTGCAGCPFNSRAEQGLEILAKYEPQLARAVRNIFAPSYEYTRLFREFKAEQKRIERNHGQLEWEDIMKYDSAEGKN